MSRLEFEISDTISECNITRITIDKEIETFDLIKYSKTRRINSTVAKAKVIQDIIKAKRSIVPSDTIQYSIFKTATYLEIFGLDYALILRNFNKENYPNLISLKLVAVNVTSELLDQISNHKNIIALVFDTCFGLDKCDWNRLNIPGLKILLTDINRDTKLNDLKFLEKHQQIKVLKLNIGKRCKNSDILSILTLKYLSLLPLALAKIGYLHLKKIFPLLKLPDAEMIHLDNITGGGQTLENQMNLKMLKIEFVINQSDLDDLLIRNNVICIHYYINKDERLNKMLMWITTFGKLLDSIFGTK